MSSVNNELSDLIFKIQENFYSLSREYMHQGIYGEPDYSNFYFKLVEKYDNGALLCENYFQNLDLEHFVQQMIKADFIEEIIELKNKIHIPHIEKTIDDLYQTEKWKN
jgi:hypothetical protein